MLKADGLLRFKWLLPDDVPTQARHVAVDGDWGTQASIAAAKVASATAQLVSEGLLAPYDLQRVRLTLMKRLIELGFATCSGRLHSSAIASEFAAYLAVFHNFPEAEAMCMDKGAAMWSLRRVLSPVSTTAHPLRYIAAAIWLYGSWGGFTTAYEDAQSSEDTSVETPRPLDESRSQENDQRRRFIELLDGGARSISAAAREVKIDVQTGLLWAASAGLPVQRRPKKMSAGTRRAIVQGLARGESKMRLSARHHLSIETITRVLLSEPRLREVRQQRIFEKTRSRARSQVANFFAKRPNAGVRAFRKDHAATFAWLYRNDRSWLHVTAGAHHAAGTPAASRVDWHARDLEFAAAANATLALSECAGTTYPVADLVRAVPGLRKKLRHLAQLPLTQAMLLEQRQVGRPRPPLALKDP